MRKNQLVVVGKNYKTISFLTGLSALVSVLGLFYKPLKLVAVPLNPEKDINATESYSGYFGKESTGGLILGNEVKKYFKSLISIILDC